MEQLFSMEQIFNKLHNFTFDIEFNDADINKLNLNKKLKPIIIEFMYISQLLNKYICENIIFDDIIQQYNTLQNNIINKIKEKITIEHSDETDLINIYKNKLTKYTKKYLNNNETNESVENIIENIHNIIKTPLEGEMAKHNKIKVITCKIININNNLDVIFYVKYKECEGYNKQFSNLIKKFCTVNCVT
jgi:hypothetical protein